MALQKEIKRRILKFGFSISIGLFREDFNHEITKKEFEKAFDR